MSPLVPPDLECPYCKAKPGEPCKTRSGMVTIPHDRRMKALFDLKKSVSLAMMTIRALVQTISMVGTPRLRINTLHPDVLVLEEAKALWGPFLVMDVNDIEALGWGPDGLRPSPSSFFPWASIYAIGDTEGRIALLVPNHTPAAAVEVLLSINDLTPKPPPRRRPAGSHPFTVIKGGKK